MAFIYDLTDTWNASGTTFNAIKMNVTDTASAAASKLVTLQVGGSERFGVDKTGIASFAGAVRGPLGSVSAPAFSFTGDTNTGMWSPAANTVAVSTDGSERMRITSSGNVGVGINSPQTALEVYRGAGTAAYLSLIGNNGVASQLYVGQDAAGLSRIFQNGANPITVWTNGTERMRIDSSGNVGIGTSGSTFRLEVRTTVGGDGLNVTDGTASDFQIKPGFSSGVVRVGPSAGAMALFTANAERMRINSSGNVGIGTSSPGALLDVRGEAIFEAAGAGRITLAQSGGANSVLSTTPSFAEWRQLNTEGSVLVFSSGLVGNHTERMRIDSSGNLLVGTTTQLASTRQTVVSGSNGVAVQVANGAVGSYMTNTSGTGDWQPFSFNVNGTSFTQVGSITITGGTTTNYNTSSDYRLKDIDGPIQNSGAYIDALKPVQGSWKADGSRFIGLLAHEVQEVSETQIATGEKDGEEMQAMDYSAPEIIANLIAEVQSLRARVAQLEGN